MDVKFEKTSDVRGLIEVSITEADYTAQVDKKLKEIGKTHVVPGFRKGHINIVELRKRFGRNVKSDVINEVVFHAVMDYIRENNLRILGHPMPADVADIDLKQTDYTFKYDVALWPSLDIALDKSVTLPYYKIEVTDEMVDDNDKQLRERFATQGPGEEADERAIIKGSIMELGADGAVRTDEDAVQVIAGIVAPFMFKDKEQAEKFMGKHVGDKVSFNPYAAFGGDASELASTLGIDREKAPEMKADFEMAISEIIVATPAKLDQEFFDNVFGPDKVHNEEEYRATLRNGITQSFVPSSLQLFTRDAHNYLVEKYGDMKLDDELLKRWLVAQNDDATMEKIEGEYDNILPGIKWEIISSEVADKLGVKVEEADLQARANFIASEQLQRYGMYNMDEETIADFGKRILSDKESRRRIAEDVEDIKMFATMRDAITLDEKTVTLDEFRKIANPQESGEEQETSEEK